MPPNQGGFTLIELLVSMVIMIVVLMAVLSVWSRLEATYTFVNEDTIAQIQSRDAMSQMIETIRTAQDPGSSWSSAGLQAIIPVAKPNEIWLWVDVAHNGGLSLIRFTTDSTGVLTLQQDSSPTSTASFDSDVSTRLVTNSVVNDATTHLFTYYDFNGALMDASGLSGVTDTAAIREVHINLMVDVAPSRSPVPNVLSSVATPRNARR